MLILGLLDKFGLMDFPWCSEVPRGQEKPIELVRGLENSRTISGLARPCMQYMHGLASPEISPGVLKTSNQFYRVAMAPRNVTAPLKVHVRKLVQYFHRSHTVNGFLLHCSALWTLRREG